MLLWLCVRIVALVISHLVLHHLLLSVGIIIPLLWLRVRIVALVISHLVLHHLLLLHFLLV